MMDNCSYWNVGHIAVHIDRIKAILLWVYIVISVVTTIFVYLMTGFRKTIPGCFGLSKKNMYESVVLECVRRYNNDYYMLVCVQNIVTIVIEYVQ